MKIREDLDAYLHSIPLELERLILRVMGDGDFSRKTQLVAALQQLWPKLAKYSGAALPGTKHYSQDRGLVDAYTLHYLPANLMKLPLIFSELETLGALRPVLDALGELQILDYGCGPGTASLGLLWILQKLSKKSKLSELVKSVTLLDHSNLFLRRASELHSAGMVEWGTIPVKSVNSSTAQTKDTSLALSNVLIFSNSLCELQEEDRASFFQRREKLSLVVIVEPGSQDPSRGLLNFRAKILEAKKNILVLTPCLSDRACGALAKPHDWCHEQAELQFPKWYDNFATQASLHKESQIFSYFVYLDGPAAELEALRHELQNKQFWRPGAARVVSQRLEEKGQTKCYFCTPQGKVLGRVIHSRIKPENEQISREFLAVQRGEVFSDLKLSEKGDILDLKARCSAENSTG